MMVKKRKPESYYVPRSGRTDLIWPAIPRASDATIIALQYQLEDTEWLPPSNIEKLQLRQIEELINYAVKHSPYYKDLLKGFSADLNDSLTSEMFRQIPILTRQNIQQAGTDLHCLEVPKDHGEVREVSSSGSTGAPITIRTTALVSSYFSALTLRYHNWHKRDYGKKTCALKLLRGKEIEDAKAGKPVSWIPGYPSGPMIMMSVDSTTAEQLDWLIHQAPEYILTYPNVLTELLEKSREDGIKIPGLKHVTTFGEVLEPGLRRLCEEVWDVPIKDSYSSMECGLMAIQCPEFEHYHIQSECILLEILRDDDTACAPGETGRVIVTDLHNFATPLIRYEIGDFAVAGEKCACGRGLPVLSTVHGRSRDMIIKADGTKSWFSPYHNISFPVGFRQMQIIQRSDTDIEILLQATTSLSKQDEKNLNAGILKNIGAEFNIIYTYVDEIARQKNGKFLDFKVEYWNEDNKKPGQ